LGREAGKLPRDALRIDARHPSEESRVTLADELRGAYIPARVKGREVVGMALRLPFNGELSPDERRLLDQGAFDEGDDAC
jgi:hypothetical protein